MVSMYSKNDQYAAYFGIVGALALTGYWIGWN